MKLIHDVRLLFGIRFVDREEERTSGLPQQANQFKIRPGKLCTAVNHHNDGGRFIEGNSGLPEDFRRDEVFVFGKNSAGVDNAEVSPPPLSVAVEAIARDAGFVANDGAPRTDDAVEQRGLAYV